MGNKKLIMCYLNYNPDTDYNGSNGIAIAEAVLQRNGYDSEKARKWVVTNGITAMVQQNRGLLRINLETSLR